MKKNMPFGFNYFLIKPYLDDLRDFIESEDLIITTKKIQTEPSYGRSDVGILNYINNNLRRKVVFPYDESVRRNINAYEGYDYIMQDREITEDSLRDLYRILSKDVLKPCDEENMGEYYRKGEVFIKRDYIFRSVFKGIDSSKVEESMKEFFDFIDSLPKENEVDTFVNALLIHYYLVNIHPYFDVNGRTARALASWYLYNNNAYTFLNFKRGTEYNSVNYNLSIDRSKVLNNSTSFVKNTLKMEREQLEIEYIVNSMEKSYGKRFTDKEYLYLTYLLSMHRDITASDSLDFFRRFDHTLGIKDSNELYSKYLDILKEKELITISKKSSSNDEIVTINRELVDVNRKKLKIVKSI